MARMVQHGTTKTSLLPPQSILLVSADLAIPVTIDANSAIAPITGTGWEEALEKAKAFVDQLTTEEKSGLVTGTEGPCVGNIAPIPRLNFSGICLQDGPLAIRQATYASVFPAGLTVAAAWDKELAYIRAVQIAEEYKAKGSFRSPEETTPQPAYALQAPMSS
jgi:beta-glucosidase-like glycosyl hydrolase